MIRKQEGMVERLGEMRKGGRERIEKGNREEIEKETKKFEEEGLRDQHFIEFLDPTLRCSHCFFKSSGWSSSIKICFLQAYRMHYF